MVRPAEFDGQQCVQIPSMDYRSITPERQDEGEQFEVAYVTADKVEMGIKYYRIRWENHGPNDDSWEPLSELEGASYCIEKYLKAKQRLSEKDMPFQSSLDSKLPEPAKRLDVEAVKKTSIPLIPPSDKNRLTVPTVSMAEPTTGTAENKVSEVEQQTVRHVDTGCNKSTEGYPQA